MKRVAFFSFLFAMASIYISCSNACSKKIDCPGFNDNQLLQWFPYSDNQQLVFRNGLNEQQNFTLRNTFTTEPYQTRGLSSSVSCHAEKNFQSVERDSSDQILFSVNLQQLSDSARSVFLNIHQTPIYFDYLRDTGFLQVIIAGRVTTREKFANLTIGPKAYTNVVAVTGDTNTTKARGIYKLYYAKEVGVIAFSDYPSLKTWIKQ